MKTITLILAVLLFFCPSKGSKTEDSSLIQEIIDIKFREAEHYLYKSEFNRSITLFQEINTLKKNDPEVCYRLGVCYFKLYNETEADKYFDLAAIDTNIRTKIQMFKQLNASNPDSNWW